MNKAYTTTLEAVGGITPFTWSVRSGALPPGLTLTPSSGAISGTPTTAGTYSATLAVTDAESPAQNASATLSITVDPGLAITTSSLPGAAVGQA